MMKPFIITKYNLQRDSWSHGDYIQYVAFVDDDTAVICRRSAAPFIFGALGFAMLLVIGLLVLNSPSDMIDWWGAGIVSIIAFMLIGPMTVELITPWRWMVQLRPEMKRRPDGSFYRSYLDE
jgi:hypothetical protein